MAKKTVETPEVKPETSVGLAELAKAFTEAIEIARPKRITPANRKVKGTPWTPKDGSPKLKLRRKMYHHSLPIETRLSNTEIDLLNKIKPGSYCEGWVKVKRRRDKGIDIDYPVKTAAQRLKLVNLYGIRNFGELLERIVAEQNDPISYKSAEELDE